MNEQVQILSIKFRKFKPKATTLCDFSLALAVSQDFALVKTDTRGCFNCQLKMFFFYACDNNNGQLMYPLAYSPHPVQQTLIIRIVFLHRL